MTAEATRTDPGTASSAPPPRPPAPAPAAASSAVSAPAPAAVSVAVSAASPGPGESRRSGPSLSPSRAADFKTCPLLYRLRSIDRLPERPTADQLRGTLVHAVLERLFDLPAEHRTPERAAGLVEPQWRRMVEEQVDLLELFTAAPDTLPGVPPGTAAAVPPDAGAAVAPDTVPVVGPGTVGPGTVGPGTVGPGTVAAARAGGPAAVPLSPEEFLSSARALLGGYFAVEDPRRLAPAERESLVSVEVDDGRLLLRGYIDRLDVSPAGDLRVVDYKTGGAPREAFEARALFQLKFYALVLWRTRGVVPRVLRLLYLKDAEICDYAPDTDELDRFERTLIALWAAIERATAERDFRPKPSRLCGWCSYQAFCPAFGGTVPPFPQPAAAPTGQPPGPGDE